MARECDGTCDTCETECYVSNAGYDNPDSEPRGSKPMTIIYCFVNGGWGDDVVGVAVCASCGSVVGQHVSSNENWAQHDLTRSYHVQDYEQHAHEQHASDAVQVAWLEKPEDSSELRALQTHKRAWHTLSESKQRSGGDGAC